MLGIPDISDKHNTELSLLLLFIRTNTLHCSRGQHHNVHNDILLLFFHEKLQDAGAFADEYVMIVSIKFA